MATTMQTTRNDRAGLRGLLGERRAQRAARRRLEHELRGFDTPAERAELEAILARATPEQASEIERVLHRIELRPRHPHAFGS